MAELKTRDLLDAGARVVVVSAEGTNQMSMWAAPGEIQWKARAYEGGDLRGAFRVVSMADAETNARVFADAESERIFCNAVDDIPNCSCYAPAVLRRGPLQIAISSAGNSPALAQRLRVELGNSSASSMIRVQQLGEARRVVFQDKTISNENRRNRIHKQGECRSIRRISDFVTKDWRFSRLRAQPGRRTQVLLKRKIFKNLQTEFFGS